MFVPLEAPQQAIQSEMQLLVTKYVELMSESYCLYDSITHLKRALGALFYCKLTGPVEL